MYIYIYIGVLKHDGTSIGCITQETYNKLVSEDKAYLPSKILDLHIQFKQLRYFRGR